VSLSGKLGQGRWRDIIKHMSQIEDFTGYFPLDTSETYFSTKEYATRRAPYIRPAIAMRVRAEARIRHYNLLMDAKSRGDIFYCDTDSIFTTSTMPIGEKVGELAFLGKAKRGYFIRQKLYGNILNGRFTQKSAGYSDSKLTESDFKDLLNGKELSFGISDVSSFKQTLKGQEVTLFEYSKKLKADESHDSRVPIDNNDTKPICL
jgi:hypothetical protein